MINRIWAVTLTVSDLKRAIHFYECILGLTKKYEFKDFAGFDCGGVEIGMKTWGKLEKPRAGEPVIDLLVDDIESAYQELRSKGVQFKSQPEEAQWGAREAVFTDPDGNELQLVQIKWEEYFKANAV